MNRRAYLTGTSLCGIAATAGCLGWFRSDQEEADEADGNTDSAGGEGDPDRHEQDKDESSEDEDTTEEAEGDTAEEDDEDELAPDREDVEPDRDEYDEPEEREVIERDSDDVTVDVSAREEDGLIRMSGSVTNVSDKFIDVVDLRFEFYDSEEGDEYVGGRLVSVTEIDPGDSEPFEEEIWADELQGELARAELVSVEVFGFPDDDTGDGDGA